jgi:hypothetical protein
MKLITELSHNVRIVDESRNGQDLKFIEGVYSTAELLNNNDRKYKKITLEREITTIMQKIEGKCLWGELGHPPNPEINPERIAIITEKLEWKDSNNVWGRSKILETPMGGIAKILIREGNLGISSRGLGTVSEQDKYVNDDFSLITWDLVTDPSNHPSWVKGVFEGQEFSRPILEVKKEIVKEVIVPVQPTSDELMLKAKEEYHKKLWQVLLDIEKNK